MAKPMTMSEALQALLRGEHISDSNVTAGVICYLRHTAWKLGYQFIDSGIGSYRSFYFTKSA